jgi:flagellar P-ring protein FlgI
MSMKTRWLLSLGTALVTLGLGQAAGPALAGNTAVLDDSGYALEPSGVGIERIKDLATIAGVRDNQLVGYGLVVGLDGTGDQTTQAPFTVQSLKNMLVQLGITVPENVNPQTKNLAAVMVTAELLPFSKPGQRMDVTVSSLGNAKSLRGGTLLMTPLKGADGQVYAMAQGNLTVNGFGAGGADGSRITVNVPSVGRIPNGATVEREVPSAFTQGDSLVLNLRRPDFTTATRVAQAINDNLGDDFAQPLDGSSIRVNAPTDPGRRVAFVSEIENLPVDPGTPPARVVVNARTGTVVMGAGVTVTPAAVSHGNLTVTISESPQVSQPGALSGGQTAVVPQSKIQVKQDKNRMFLFAPGTALGDIVTAVNEVGAAPGDLVAILEALREAGALRAELVVL